MSSLFRKKDINILTEHSSPLKRTLRTWDLTFLGIGAGYVRIIGVNSK